MANYFKLNKAKEYYSIKIVLEQAEIYKENLTRLLNINFDNPDDNFKEFAIKNNFDLKDEEVKNEIINYRKKYLKLINTFYENIANISEVAELLKINSKSKMKKSTKSNSNSNPAKEIWEVKIVNKANQKLDLDKNASKESKNTMESSDSEEVIKLKKNVQHNTTTNNNHSKKIEKLDKRNLFFQFYYIVLTFIVLVFSLVFLYIYLDF